MKLFFTLFLFLSFAITGSAQSVISGKVTDKAGQPVPGASVSLDNTLDGATTDTGGHFKFQTTETGLQTLAVTAIGYQAGGMPLQLTGNVADLQIFLKAAPRSLDNVTVTAGAFEAGNDKGKTILTTLDIVTTAGANADVVQAIQTLPGTQKTGTESGLFVRGGDASEASVVVDGLTVQNAFYSSAPGVASRSRFMPWAFKGVSFSSGGYSARYGQALSSVLELNTLDMPERTTITTGLNFAGIYASGQKLWKNSGGGITAGYNNLSPFYKLAKTNVDYYKVPRGGSASANYSWRPSKSSLLKTMISGMHFQSGMRVADPSDAAQTIDFGLKSTNFFGNVSYEKTFGAQWQLFSAASYSANRDDINWNGVATPKKDNRLQARLEGKRFFNSQLTLLTGGEWQHYTYELSNPAGSLSFTEDLGAFYAEANWSPSKRWAFRPGVRADYSRLLQQARVAPRLSIAYRTGRYSQIGLAYGLFYQNPDPNYLLYGYRPDMQLAAHYIANFQWMTDERTLRVEGYYKDYQNLLREKGFTAYDPNTFRNYFGNLQIDNSGFGYAGGAELFWRDKKAIKNLDYWVSYSYIDTRRLYQNFPESATPSFIANHNLSLVGKYWINKWHSQINMTYAYASGRTYYNPNTTDFLSDHTPAFHNLALTFNYLTSVKKWFTVVYAGVDNLTNHHNIFGYRYSADGAMRFPQRPAIYRSFFIGVNFSLTEFNRDEL